MIAANVQRDTRECYLLPDRRMDGWMWEKTLDHVVNKFGGRSGAD